MAMAAGHGATTMMVVQGNVLSTQYCAERASVQGRGAAARTMTTARISRVAGFGCSSEGAAAVSSSPYCRIWRGTVVANSNRRSASRKKALTSRQADVAVGGEADSMADEEPMASFWYRLQQAWLVLIGRPSEVQATRRRFSRLLVRDRGFSPANLSRLYNVAKVALKEHVELEGDEDAELTAVVDRLGELRLDFRVKRVKSRLLDEPYSHAILPGSDPCLSISGDQLWDSSRGGALDLEARVGGAFDELDVEPSLSIGGDQLWEYGRAPLDLKARVGGALDRPRRNSVVPEGEASLSISGDQLWASSAPRELGAYVEGVSELNLSSVGRASDEYLPNPVPDVEPHLSTSGGQVWDDNRTSQDLEVQVSKASNLKSTTVDGAWDEPPTNSVVPDVELNPSISGDQLSEENRANGDLQLQEGTSESTSTSSDTEGNRDNGDLQLQEGTSESTSTSSDSEGIWYTFSFRGDELGQGTVVEEDLE